MFECNKIKFSDKELKFSQIPDDEAYHLIILVFILLYIIRLQGHIKK